MTRIALLALWLLAPPAWPGARIAAPGSVDTDANVVTALDISESVSTADSRRQLLGLAAAIQAPEVLAAIRAGRTGRIGFAVFAWHQRRVEVTPWTLIATEADAAAVAHLILSRIAVDVDVEARAQGAFYAGRLTDLSSALDHAADLLAAAPFAAKRRVVNIVGNGGDNMGEPAAPARDRFLAANGTVNGVVVGGDADAIAYFDQQVVGGLGSFLLDAGDADVLSDLMRRKLVQDLVAGVTIPEASAVARN